MNADLATLNTRFDQFETHIRVQETKLHQNPTFVEKIFFLSKMAFTLPLVDKRRIFSDTHIEIMKQYYAENPDTIESEKVHQFAKDFGCTPKQVYSWFYRQRDKDNQFNQKRCYGVGGKMGRKYYSQCQLDDLMEYYNQNSSLRRGF